MKLKKLLGIALSVVMACGALTGCVGVIGDTTINADGSGTITASIGFSEQAWEMIKNAGMATDDSAETTFVYNGVKYVGNVEKASFNSVEEFNASMAEVSDGKETGIKAGLFELSKNSDGTLTLTLNVDQQTGNTDKIEMQMTSNGSEMTEEQIKELMAELNVVFTFTFASDVKQTAGETAGVTITGNKLTIDIMKLSEKLQGNAAKLVFTTGTGSSSTVVEPTPTPVKPAEPTPTPVTPVEPTPTPVTPVTPGNFSDVNTSDWFYAAVSAMAKGGLVQGVGNGKFAPQDTLTYAQFCQILAKAQGRETGEKNGYWAYKAIESCRSKGDIIDLGPYTPANYDVPIPREAAVAGMFRAKAKDLYAAGKVGNSIKETDIPDYNRIDANYKWDILDAYNSGITTGIDSNKTFNPKGILTRAEVCQLFYNLNWTTTTK